MKKFHLLLLFAMVLVPAELALAHEQWFVQSPMPMSYKPALFSVWTSVNSAMTLLAIFGLLAALLIHFALRPHRTMKRLRKNLASYTAWGPSFLRVATGLLLFMGSFSRFMFGPDLSTAFFMPIFERVVLAVQLLAGLGLLLGVFPRFMALLGFTLYALSFFLFPFTSLFSYIFFAGVFFYLVIAGDASLPRTRGGSLFPNLIKLLELDRAKPYAMAVLRMATGISFIWTGYFFKIFQPGYALGFLGMHDMNFMARMGFHMFNNEMFVLSAGAVEVTLGVLIFLGLLPRLAGALLFLLFTVTFSMLGIYELLGHLPLYAVAFMLITQGGGERWSAEQKTLLRRPRHL